MNPESAQWCGQCHASFAAPVSPPPPPPPVPASTPGAAQSPDSEPLGPGKSNSPREQRGVFVVTDSGILWTCSICGTQNPIDRDLCGTCGTAFRTLVAPPTDPRRRHGSPQTAAVASLLLPGVGHAYLGLWGQAVARGVIGLWLLATVITALAIGGSSSKLMAMTFGAAALGLWAVSAHDAAQEATGRPGAALLKGRMFLWVVLGLLALMMVQVLAAGMGGR